MEKGTAELIVNIYAILAWFGAFVSVVAGLAFLFGGSLFGGMGSMMGDAWGMPGGIFAGIGVLMALIFLAAAVLDVFVGFGLWHRKEWARILTIVFSVLGLFSFPIGTIIGAFGIYFFGFDETVKGLFGPAPIVAAPVQAPAKKARKAAKRKK